MNIDSNTTIYLNNTEIVQIYDGGGQVIWQKGSTPPTPTPENFYLKNESSSTNSMYLDATKDYGFYDGVYYSTDGTNWTYLDRGVTVNFSDKLYLKSDDFGPGGDYYAYMSCSQNFSLGGDITTLSPYVILNYLFSNNTNLISVSNIDMSNVGNTYTVFSGIFSGCTNLTDCIDLSGITSGYFENMYNGCSSLNRAVAPTLSSIGNELNNWLNGVAASGTFYNYYSAIPLNSASGVPSGWTYQPTPYFTLSNVVLIMDNTITTNYQVTAQLDTNMNWSKMTIDISNCDVGPCNRNTYLDITPSEVSNNQLVSSNDINIWFGNPDDWMTITVYDSNNTQIYSETNIPYITVNPNEPS